MGWQGSWIRVAHAESGYCLPAAKRLRYLDETHHEALDRDVRRVAKPLRGLMESLGS